MDNYMQQTIEEAKTLMEDYGFYPTTRGVTVNVNKHVANKKWMCDLFSKLPEWDEENHMLVFKKDWVRPIDTREARELLRDLKHYVRNNMEIQMYSLGDYNKMCEVIQKYTEVGARLFNGGTYGGMNWDALPMFLKFRKRLQDELENNECSRYTMESRKRNFLCRDLTSDIMRITSAEEFDGTLTAETLPVIQHYLNELRMDKVRLCVGQRFMKIVRKFAIEFGFDKDPSYNSWVARMGDAITPLSYKRYTVISLNFKDYMMMSNGSDWRSCHTIDKGNRDRYSGMNHYHGLYCAGTLSYALDNCTAVMYTVDADYSGRMQDAPKVTRQMIQFGDNDILFGRVYPQKNDSAESDSLRKQYREFVQWIYAKALGVDNYWSTCDATSETGRRTIFTAERALHYQDYVYENFNCKLCYLKGQEPDQIEIGHESYCIECGRVNSDHEQLSCCRDFGDYICSECGQVGDEDTMHQIDGRWYCEDCCFYCDYHEEWEVGERTYVEDYYGGGNVCESALCDSGNFVFCDGCNQWHYEYSCNPVYTNDGHSFCSPECAESYGYVYVENECDWYYEDDVTFCSRCNEYVLNRNYDSEHDMCCDCYENESETVEEVIA